MWSLSMFILQQTEAIISGTSRNISSYFNNIFAPHSQNHRTHYILRPVAITIEVTVHAVPLVVGRVDKLETLGANIAISLP